MRVLKLILEIWYLILPAAVFIGGLIYRKITHQPFKGEIPPVGVPSGFDSAAMVVFYARHCTVVPLRSE